MGVVVSAPYQMEGLPDIWGPEVLAWAPSRVGISLTGITALLLPSCPLYPLLSQARRGGVVLG